MQRFARLVLASVIFVGFTPAWAFECPTLIKEGKELLSSSKLPAAEQKKIRALLNEAQKAHDAGNHGESTKKAREALALLGKK
ncbi:MAG TPA: hypothetical protein VNL14_11715 [Candidatus Acidoferrales bacterium]|nr:hypothetical protein [Candidatus Acidoferrales bacterium]